jgi:hypothetical protein
VKTGIVNMHFIQTIAKKKGGLEKKYCSSITGKAIQKRKGKVKASST